MLKLFYQFLKLLVRFSFRLYFPRTVILHQERLSFDEPGVLVSNHPNTLVDPLNVASRNKKLVYFLANASLYTHPIASSVLKTFYTIPIRRQEDKVGAAINNNDSFRECIDFLSQGGCIWIAPEGNSHLERRLRPLKTGTARIAMATEAANDFKLGLRIQPVGLTYEKPNFFRTGVIINVGEPMYLAEWQEQFRQDSFQVSRQFTKELDKRLRSLMIDTKDDAEEQLLLHLETFNRSEDKYSELEIYERSQGLLTGIRALAEAERKQLELEVARYVDALKIAGITDKSVVQQMKKAGLGTRFLFLLLALPLFLYGLLHNMLPAFTIVGLTRRLKLYVGYNSTVKIVGGLFIFPLFYAIQALLVHKFFFPTGWWTVVYLLSLIPAGLFSWHYWKIWKETQALWRIKRLQQEEQASIIALRKVIRDKILLVL